MISSGHQVRTPSRPRFRERLEPVCQIVVWGALSGLCGAALLIVHVLLRAPFEITGASSPAHTLARMTAVSVLLSTMLVLTVVASARLLGHWLPGLDFRTSRPAASAGILAAAGPMILSWTAFGLVNGETSVGALALIALAVFATLALAPLLGAWLARVVPTDGWVRILSSAFLIVSVALLSISMVLPAPGTLAERLSSGSEPESESQVPVTRAQGRGPGIVVLLTIDTLRADHLGCHGYPRSTSPNIDRLAAEGMLFESMLAASSGTVPSMVTVLSGLYPACHGARDQWGRLPARVNTLAERFRGGGYSTFAVVSNRLLSAKSGFARGFDAFSNLGDVPATRVVGEVAELLEDAAQERVFAWVHFMDPHTPYVPPADLYEDFLGDAEYSHRRLKKVDFGSYTGVNLRRVLGDSHVATPRDLELGYLVARYDGEIRSADRGVGEVVELFSSRFGAENTTVLLISDHGETLYRSELDPIFQHALDVHQSTIHVPGILWAPGRVAPGSRMSSPVHHVDVLPTLLALGDIEPSATASAMTGTSLAAAGPRERTLVSQTAWWDGLSLKLLPARERQPAYAVIHGSRKYIHHPRTDLAALRGPLTWLHAWRSVVLGLWGPDRLYDLDRDPQERTDLLDESSEDARRLGKWLAEHFDASLAAGCGTDGEGGLDWELEQELRALGYLD